MKKYLVTVTPENSALAEIVVTALRVFVGLSMAFGHGLGKIPPPEGLVSGVAGLGFPMPELFAWAAALTEFVGGLALAAGLLTRPSAAFIAFTMAIAAFGVHAQDAFQKKEMALLYFFVAIVFMIRGAGRVSIDSKL